MESFQKGANIRVREAFDEDSSDKVKLIGLIHMKSLVRYFHSA